MHQPDALPALLIPDSRVEIWPAESSYTEAGPEAGIPSTTSSSRLSVRAYGEQSAAIELQTILPGFASREQHYDSGAGQAYPLGAQFIWRDSGGSSWYGHDPAFLTEITEAALWGAGTVTVRDPVVLALPSGALIAAADVVDTSFPSSAQSRVEVLTRPSAGTWGSWTRTVTPYAETSGLRFRPALLLLPSGRVHLYHVVSDNSSGSTLYQVRCWSSDNDGASWAYQGEVLEEEIALLPDRIRVAYGDGQVVMLIAYDGASSSKVAHYASADLGLTYRLVETLEDPGTSPPYAASEPDVVYVPGAGFVVIVQGYEAATGVYSWLLPDAYDLLTDETGIVVQGSAGSTALAVDDAGAVYCYAVETTGGQTLPVVSYDAGSTWSDVYTPGSEGLATMGSTVQLRTLSATWHRGRVILAHTYSGSTADNSLGIAYLGGWSTLARPTHNRRPVDTFATRWTTEYYPVVDPPAAIWTTSGTGSDAAESPGRLRVTCTAGQTRIYTRTPGSTLAEGVGVRFAVIPSSTDETTLRNSVLVRVGTGAASYAVEVRLSTTALRLYDASSGTLIGQPQVISGAVEVEVWVGEGVAALWWRAADTSEARSWTVGPSSSTVGNAGALSGTIAWGQRATDAVTRETVWGPVLTCEADSTGQGLQRGQSNPSALRGRLWAGRPYIGRGVSVVGTSGPTWRGETWSIATRARYRLSQALERSPRVRHRTTSTAAQTYAFRWDEGLDESTRLSTGILGVYLDANWAEVAVSLYLPGTGWVSAGTVQRYTGGLPATVSGSSVRASGGPGLYLHAGEAVGSTVVLGSPGTGRRIVRQSEGRWSAGPLRPVLVMEGADGSEAGDASILWQRTVLVLDLRGVAYSGIRFVVAAASSSRTPAEGYWELRQIEIGAIQVLARPYSWGRVVSRTPAVDLLEGADRIARSRTRAPIRRQVEIGWTDGVDLTQIEGEQADPETVLGSTDGAGEAGGSPAGVPYLLAALLAELEGPGRAAVYIPRLPVASGLRQLLRPEESIRVRLDSGIRIESRQGEENTDEVVNVATITLTEEV